MAGKPEPSMKEYMLVSGETLESLVAIVNQFLMNGWQVQGGPLVVSKYMWENKPENEVGKLIVQALIRDNQAS